jgi:Polyketide cyclase / dehydrase and lipid transport
VSAYRQQAHLDVPIETVWELVGNPLRHPEWWPRVIEVRGERFDEGDQYAQVTRGPIGKEETHFLVETRSDLREIQIRCMKTGTYAQWLLAEARGGTFVDLELGMDPNGVTTHLFDTVVGRLYFRRWCDQSVEALQQAVKEPGVTAG